MIRLFLYLGLIVAVATGLAFLADNPGSLTIEWLGTEVRTSFLIGVVALIIAFALLLFALWLGVAAYTAPGRLLRSLKERKIKVGREALRRGLFAASAGNKTAALRASAVAKKHLPEEPLALLLEAQSAQLNEDGIAARQVFERMLEKPDLAEVGLRGLYIEAKKQGQTEAAKHFAERALALNPALGWSSAALFDIQCREGDWRGALKSLTIAKQYKHISRHEADKRKAIALTALALELEDTQQGRALAYAQEAISLDPNLTQASIIAGRILAAQGNVSRAAKVVASAWQRTPHPELALIYAYARTGDSPRDRLARVRTLTSSGRRTLTGDLALAVAAIEAKEWLAARAALEPYLGGTPSAEVCRLMARIEAGQNRDKGRAREWLAKAARGAPSPVWVAPDGSVATEWRPMTPTGLLGGYEWRLPPVAHDGDGAAALPEISALDLPELDIKPEATQPSPLGREPAKAQKGEITEPATAAPADAEPKEPSQKEPQKVAAAPAVALPAVVDAKGGVKLAREEQAQALQARSIEAGEGEEPKGESGSFAPRIFIAGRPPDDPGPKDDDDISPSIIPLRKPR